METMAISAKEVNELRKQTGAGLMDCKKALTEANGDMQAAIDFLRKKGQKVAELRAGRESSEGVVIAQTTADNTKGIALYLSCETDFVAKNDDFIGFAKELTDFALNEGVNTADELMGKSVNGITIQDKVAEKIGAIGENIAVSSLQVLEGEQVVPYIHAGYKIGVLVALNQNAAEPGVEIGRDVAMQVAAMNPIGVNEGDVPADVKEREMQIGREQALAEGKPEQIIDKIAEGKLKKYYKENTLINQQFVKDGSKTVGDVLNEVSKGLTVTSFKRVALGDK